MQGCKKYVDIAPPRTSLNSDLVFTDGKTAESALTGIYSNLNSYNSSFANSNGNFFPAFSADEFQTATSSAEADEFRENKLTPSNRNVSGLWSQPYSLIYQANAVIAGLTKSSTIPEAKSRQLMGEAKFLRAFFYFYLVNYFGDVPLVLSTDFLTNTGLPREKSATVYDAIVQDLTEAQAALSDDYPVAERIRANKAAATALLARVYLYRGQWDKAEAEASKVLSDGRYVLLANPDNVFLRTSTEAIWQLAAINTSTAGPVNTWEGYSIIPINATTAPGYVMYPNFVSSFERPTDKRLASWLRSYTPAAGGTTVYYPLKYKVRIGTVTEYSMVLRKAEQFLIRAEARAQQTNLAGAKSDLDSIRIRAGLPVLAPSSTKEQLLLAVESERKTELFLEWGHRWFDLRRTNRALTVLSAKPGLTASDLYYPIPLDAILTNGKLVQNAGY